MKLSEAEFRKLTNEPEKPKKTKKPTNHANKGMALEKLIEKACEQYEANGIANIKKVSTPWTVIRKGPRIVNAFPSGPSTVDFMGDVKGRSICFEAKKTENKTSFPLSNFEDHQIEFMRNWKGIKFVIIEFTAKNKVFYCTWEFIHNWWNEYKGDGRKSIPYSSFDAMCLEVKQHEGIVLDYLKHIEVAI
jgi:recombination protein U